MHGPATIAQFASFQRDLAALRRAFADTPERQGAIGALSGFAYQMQTTLLALLKAWTAEPERFKSDPDLVPLLVEALSDYTELSSKAIVCCQVKLTLRSDTTLKALNEFWLILNIAKREKLGIVDEIRF